MRVENDVINRILDAYKPMWSLNHAISLMGWDFETYMPRKGTFEFNLGSIPVIINNNGNNTGH